MQVRYLAAIYDAGTAIVYADRLFLIDHSTIGEGMIADTPCGLERLLVVRRLLNLRSMRRFTGERLPASPRIAVMTNDALGNFVVVTPLLQMLREEYSTAALDYYGGTRVAELAGTSSLVDRYYDVHGVSPRAFAESLPDVYQLVVNVERSAWAKAAAAMLAGEEGLVCGPCIDQEGRGDLPYADDTRGDLWRDEEWIAEDITKRYPFLRSGFIGEIFCRLAYLDGPAPGYLVPRSEPSQAVPDVLVSTTASLAWKLWPIDRWQALVRDVRARDLTVGLLGAKPKQQEKYWEGAGLEAAVVEAGAEDLRGRFTLPEVVGAIDRARLVATIDNGISHFACATDTPTVGLFRHGIHRLWAPPAENLRLVEPGKDRQVSDIEYETVWSAVEEALG
jgi:ADP-heptose:LPS heptosyltransferase